MTDEANLLQRLQATDIRWLAIVLSVLFSLVIIAANPIPNDDAFSYIRAAEIFTAQGLNATLATYGWYGYSILIALLDNIVGIGLIQSAHLLNTLAFALLVYAFITLVMEYRQSDTAIVFAAAVILCFPTINEMRYYLIRDFAYWGFCLTALVQLCRFNKTGLLIHAGGWLLAMAAAVFFRLEGLLLIALSPFALLLPVTSAASNRFRLFITLMAFLIGGLALIMVLFLLAGINLLEISSFAYRWYLPLLADYPATLSGAATNASLSEHISSQLAPFTGKGYLILFAGYFYMVVANLVMTLGPPVSVFLAYGFMKGRQSLPAHCKLPWLFFLIGSLLSLLIFVSIMQFLTTRYAVITALLLLTLAPLSLETWYMNAKYSGKLKSFRTITGIFLCYFLVDSLLSFGYSKNYVLEAAAWSRENLEASDAIHTNSFPVAYYSGLVEEYDSVNSDPVLALSALAGNDFLILDLGYDADAARDVLTQHSELVELIRFSNTRDDAIIIYQIAQ